MRRWLHLGAAAAITLGACGQAAEPASACRKDRPLSDRSGAPGLHVPILMYHHVGDPNPRWTLPPVRTERFDAQMRAIAEAGVATLTIADLEQGARQGREFPEGAVAITLDDGIGNQYENAWPILQRYGVRATFYIATGRVGRDGYMTWDQIRELDASGLVTIAAHTVTHPDLTALSREEAWGEIKGSRDALEGELGRKVRHFAYPFGRYNAETVELVREAGFTTATTVEPWELHRPRQAFTWGRSEVYQETPPSELARRACEAGTWRSPS